MSEWKPIETAPKDGSLIFVYSCDIPISLYPCVAFWDVDAWVSPLNGMTIEDPDYWMSLPDPPTRYWRRTIKRI